MADTQDASKAFALARANAINKYAELEEMLAHLFATLLNTDTQKAYVVFSKIINARSRREMLSSLLEMTYPKAYTTFFASLMKNQRDIDDDRNKVVHWIVKVSVTGGKAFNPESDIALHQHPNIFSERRMLKSELYEFTAKADFLRLVTFYFSLHLSHGIDESAPGKKPWREIFQQQIQYPPQTDHPLNPSGKAP